MKSTKDIQRVKLHVECTSGGGVSAWGAEAGWHFIIFTWITRRKAQGPSRTCNASEEGEEDRQGETHSRKVDTRLPGKGNSNSIVRKKRGLTTRVAGDCNFPRGSRVERHKSL